MSRIFPLLEKDNVRVLPFSSQHLTEQYVSWLNDPEVVRYSEQRHYQHTLQTCRHYYESTKQSPHFFLAIEQSTSSEHIGNIGVAIDPYNHLADVSILLGEKKVWGKGYASLAWRLVLDELLRHHFLRKITAGTMAVNEPMLRLMQRTGMQIEARREGHFLWEGQEVALVQAAIFCPQS